MTHLYALLVLLALQAILLNGFPETLLKSEVQLTLNFGFLLLAAYLFGEWTSRLRLPKLSGYLFAGILLGPDLLGYFTPESITSLLFFDELALTYIALSAGLELRIQDLRKQWRVLGGLIFGVPLLVFPSVYVLMRFLGSSLGLTTHLSGFQLTVLASLVGVLAIARSPSSTVAVIKECKARGNFSETVLGATVGTDILVIIFFSIFLAMSGTPQPGNAPPTALPLWVLLPVEICLSFLLGLGLAWAMATYSRFIRADLLFFLLCIAFLVTKLSSAASDLLASLFSVPLHMEPLLICMSAGFFLQNLFDRGSAYEEAIDQSSLPIFVIFFALAGTGLDIQALRTMWQPALLLAAVRAAAMIVGSEGVVRVLGERDKKGHLFGLSFLTQAGVSVGLISLIPQQFPQAGKELYTLLLAMIVINQLAGPITLKFALEKSGDAKRR